MPTVHAAEVNNTSITCCMTAIYPWYDIYGANSTRCYTMYIRGTYIDLLTTLICSTAVPVTTLTTTRSLPICQQQTNTMIQEPTYILTSVSHDTNSGYFNEKYVRCTNCCDERNANSDYILTLYLSGNI